MKLYKGAPKGCSASGGRRLLVEYGGPLRMLLENVVVPDHLDWPALLNWLAEDP